MARLRAELEDSGLAADPTLSEVVSQAGDPWADLLAAERQALQDCVRRIEQLLEQSRLLQGAHADLLRQMASTFAGGETDVGYDRSGQAVHQRASARFLDTQA